MHNIRFLWERLHPLSLRHMLYLVQRAAVVALRFAPLKLLPLHYFQFDGQRYPYFYRRYNGTWVNERSVEVPLVWRVMQQYPGAHVLEVGHVLGHYFTAAHDVVDKYERAPGVQNIDVIEHRAAQPYDLIVSISTLEHVGWDETPQQVEKALRAVAHLTSLLAPNGRLFVTFPLGYHPLLDALAASFAPVEREHSDALRRVQITAGLASGATCRYLRRVSRLNSWVEANWRDVRAARYNDPYPGAAAIAVLSYSSPAASN